MSVLGKIHMLLSSRAKATYATQVIDLVFSALQNNTSKITTTIGVVPRGYILVTDVHPSRSDPKPHWTVDAYGLDQNHVDKPIGTVHVYEDGSVEPYDSPRRKATEAYNNKVNAATST